MSELANEHVKSVDRALTILRIHLDRQKVPKYAKEFERDIRRLEQVKKYIEKRIQSPMFNNISETASYIAW